MSGEQSTLEWIDFLLKYIAYVFAGYGENGFLIPRDQIDPLIIQLEAFPANNHGTVLLDILEDLKKRSKGIIPWDMVNDPYVGDDYDPSLEETEDIIMEVLKPKEIIIEPENQPQTANRYYYDYL